jgi:PPOX class probable F420-dependent enzyme
MIIPDALRELIATGPLAHITTINPDGSPQVTIVWVGLDGDELVAASMEDRQKLKNVRRDPRMAISFLGPVTNAWGLREHAVVYGSGYITEGGAADLLQRLAHVYLDPDVVFPPEPYRSLPGYILHLKPERITGVGPWVES